MNTPVGGTDFGSFVGFLPRPDMHRLFLSTGPDLRALTAAMAKDKFNID
jgi:hypothetical protein